MKQMLFFLFVALFLGCHQSKKLSDDDSLALSEVEMAYSTAMSRDVDSRMSHEVHLLDSLLTSLYIEADPDSKACQEWKWARQTRGALGKTEELKELDSLNALSFDVDKIYAPLTAGSPIENSEAAGVFASTAVFRLLNAYQVLASMLSESLDEDWFLQDYKLWEDVYREYEKDHANAFGRSTGYMLGIAHKSFSELRRTIVMEEIGYLSADRDGAAEWYVNATEIKWPLSSKAIRAWYDHRMKMADKLGNTNLAEYFRRLTYKAVFIYQHFQLDWEYDFEKQ